jgi:neutral ceramidase
LLKTPGKDQVECHSPKPILLDTGEMKEPYDWAVWLLSLSLLIIVGRHMWYLYI